MSYKVELLQVLPTEPGWISVTHAGNGLLDWEPVFSMALVLLTWYNDDGSIQSENKSIAPLVYSPVSSTITIATEDGEDFGVMVDSDSFSLPTVLHWSKVLKFYTTPKFVDREGLEEYVATFKNESLGSALNNIATALHNLGFGSVNHEGAIEGHTMRMQKATEELSSALGDGLGQIATALEELAGKLSE